jgi:3'-phosphoadenosine 5'-phosphosulfate sulfotransferase (PAPS reductase)/FAD synthetase
MKITKEEFDKRIGLSLDEKINLSIHTIERWYFQNDEKVFVSFSGGKDSTVLLHIVRRMFPKVIGVFVDTGLEYPENRELVKKTENIIILKPKKKFNQIINEFGYPVVSKDVSYKVHMLQNPSEKNAKSRHLYLTGETSTGNFSRDYKLAKKWLKLIDSGIKISDKCCFFLKEEPINRYVKETGSLPIIGSLAIESKRRRKAYMNTGCNHFSKNKMRSRSMPIAFWTEDNIWEYIRKYNLEYSKIYDMGIQRTGCMFCTFGIMFDKEPNRFQLMKEMHPKHYNYCINKLKIGKILDLIGKKY